MTATTPSPLITKTHPHQSDAILALLNHVARHGQVGWAELFAMFECAASSPAVRLTRFNAKMHYLITTDRLQCTGHHGDRIFSLGASANQPASQRGRTNAKAGQTDGSDMPRPYPNLQYLGTVTPPRQYDAMHGDAYVHVLQPPIRPGALDYKCHASRGHQC